MRIYLAPGEVVPLRVLQKKSDVMKVMFLAAIARPRFNDAGECRPHLMVRLGCGHSSRGRQHRGIE